MGEKDTGNSIIIKLNVGGITYYSYHNTLVKSKYFQTLLDGDMQNLVRVNDQEIFIDRCGLHFEYILQYLRTGLLLVGPDTKLEDLKLEAEYYQLKELVETINGMINGMIKSPKLKQVEYRLMDLTELTCGTVKKPEDIGKGVKIKTAANKTFQVLEVLDVKQEYKNMCFYHDKYTGLKPCEHPNYQRSHLNQGTSKLLVKSANNNVLCHCFTLKLLFHIHMTQTYS